MESSILVDLLLQLNREEERKKIERIKYLSGSERRTLEAVLELFQQVKRKETEFSDFDLSHLKEKLGDNSIFLIPSSQFQKIKKGADNLLNRRISSKGLAANLTITFEDITLAAKIAQKHIRDDCIDFENFVANTYDKIDNYYVELITFKGITSVKKQIDFDLTEVRKFIKFLESKETIQNSFVKKKIGVLKNFCKVLEEEDRILKLSKVANFQTLEQFQLHIQEHRKAFSQQKLAAYVNFKRNIERILK